MTEKNEQNETLKNAQHTDVEDSGILTPSTGGVKEAGYSKTADLELADLGKHYGVKETLSYVRGLNMENVENAGEVTGDQNDDLKEIGYQPHCDCEFGDLDKKEKLPSEKKSK